MKALQEISSPSNVIDSVADAGALQNEVGKPHSMAGTPQSHRWGALGSLRRIFDRISSAIGRRFGRGVLRCLSRSTRADVLERCSDEMICEVTLPSGRMLFHAPSQLLRSRAEKSIVKEPDTIAWIDRFRDGAIFWDIGANVGVFSLYAGIQKNATVMSFEPAAGTYHVLCRNIQLNRFKNNVVAFCLAFAGQTKLGVLNLSSLAAGSATHQFGDLGERSRFMDANHVPASQGMCGFTIDQFIAEFSPPFPEHIKIDVDGIEVDILEGARRTLSDPRLRSLMVELNIDDAGENNTVIALLRQAGFRLVSQGEIQGVGEERAANHFFEKYEDSSSRRA